MFYEPREKKERKAKPRDENLGKNFRRIRTICAAIHLDKSRNGFEKAELNAILKMDKLTDKFNLYDGRGNKIRASKVDLILRTPFSMKAIANQFEVQYDAIRNFEKGLVTSLSQEKFELILDHFKLYIKDNEDLFRKLAGRDASEEFSLWTVTMDRNIKPRTAPRNGKAFKFYTGNTENPITPNREVRIDKAVHGRVDDSDLAFPI